MMQRGKSGAVVATPNTWKHMSHHCAVQAQNISKGFDALVSSKVSETKWWLFSILICQVVAAAGF